MRWDEKMFGFSLVFTSQVKRAFSLALFFPLERLMISWFPLTSPFGAERERGEIPPIEGLSRSLPAGLLNKGNNIRVFDSLI